MAVVIRPGNRRAAR